MYPNSALSAWQLAVVAVVPVSALAGWLVAIFLAAREHRRDRAASASAGQAKRITGEGSVQAVGPGEHTPARGADRLAA